MGFSSFLCCKSSQSIPAYPYSELPAVLSHVRVIFPDDSFIEGFYDGYNKVHSNPDFQAYCTSEEVSDEYHQDQRKAVNLWDELESRGLLTDSDSFKDYYSKMKIVRVINYENESFNDLPRLANCPDQGYFYDSRARIKLLKSF